MSASSFRLHPGTRLTASAPLTVPADWSPNDWAPVIPIVATGPSCFVANRPRPSRPAVRHHLPDAEALPKAETIAELRRWHADNAHWLRLSRWSRGIPALITPVRPRRKRLAPEAMNLQALIDSQHTELPSIAQEIYSETRYEVLSADLPPSGQETDDDVATIGSQIPDDVRTALYQGVADDYTDPDDEPVPLAVNLDRVEWESYVTQCSEVRTEGFYFVAKPSGGYRVDYRVWPVPKGMSRQTAQDRYTERWMAERNLSAMPDIQWWLVMRARMRAHERNIPARTAWETAEAAFAEMANDRWWLENTTGGMSTDGFDFDYVPSYALLSMQEWAKVAPTRWVGRDTYRALRAQAREAAYRNWSALYRQAVRAYRKRVAEGEALHYCRNTFDHASVDEMWHAQPRDPEEFVIGWADGDFAYASRQLPHRYVPPRKPFRLEPVSAAQLLYVRFVAQQALATYKHGSVGGGAVGVTGDVGPLASVEI